MGKREREVVERERGIDRVERVGERKRGGVVEGERGWREGERGCGRERERLERGREGVW